MPTGGRLAFHTLFLVGLGSDVDLEALRKAGGRLGRKAARTVDVATTLHQVDIDGAAGAVTEGFLLGQYRFDTYKSEPKPAKTETLRFIGRGAEEAAGQAVDAAVIVDAVALARDLTNEPALAKAPAVLADKAREIGADTILLPECGHAYGAARWEAAQWYGGPTGVRILHMIEFLADRIESGAIELKKAKGSATFHDPCQLIRRGGLERAPRVILEALGFDLRELEDHGITAFCCGGGGGVLANARAEPLRLKAFELKKSQVEATKAEHFFTSCGQCRLQFTRGAQHFKWKKPIESLLEAVDAHMTAKR